MARPEKPFFPLLQDPVLPCILKFLFNYSAARGENSSIKVVAIEIKKICEKVFESFNFFKSLSSFFAFCVLVGKEAQLTHKKRRV